MKFYLFLFFAVTTSALTPVRVGDPIEIVGNAFNACKNKKLGDTCEYEVSCVQAIFL